MDKFKVKTLLAVIVLLACYFNENVNASDAYFVEGGVTSRFAPYIVPLEARYRRDVPATPTAATPVPPSAPVAPAASGAPAVASTTASPASTAAVSPAHSDNTTVAADDANRTTNLTQVTSAPPPSVTKVPRLLGVNGSGILNVDLTGNNSKVSDPIMPDDQFTNNVYKEVAETAKEHHVNLTKDNNNFYNSSMVFNKTEFDEHWASITQGTPIVHPILSDSHRRATTLRLSFDFPFYGHLIRNVTVATGGFIYTGDPVHNWLAATQYIAPLMANFDTRITNTSLVKLYDDGEKFTALWENVNLQESKNKSFTFAATLYKNGDIVFAYKELPMEVQAIDDDEHPVKLGISDAYLTDNVLFNVRKKTVYEYHRVSFKNHGVTNATLLRLTALPTCLQYNSCDACLNHRTGFNCTWCEVLQRCSTGTDRHKQDWVLRNCDNVAVTNASSCAGAAPRPAATASPAKALSAEKTEQPSAVGGVVAAFVCVTLVCCAAAWLLYAFKYPHTRSGQLLIKYRPSQWSWRRGEARYTAATIHM